MLRFLRNQAVRYNSTMEPAITDQIIERLAAGETLRAICRTPGFPTAQTVRYHVVENRAFSERYARARTAGLDEMAEEIVELADVCREGVKTERKQIGWQCSACSCGVTWAGRGWLHGDNSELCAGATSQRVYEEKMVTGDMVERAKLQLDARKWLLSKLRPDKYGDRTIVSGDQAAPISVTVAYEDRPAKLGIVVSPKLLPAPLDNPDD